MTSDLQERLHDDLAGLRSSRLDLGIDTDDLIRDGHHRLRSRVAVTSLGALTTVVLAAVLGFTMVLAPGRSGAPVVPAAPAPSGALTDAAYFRGLDGMGFDKKTERLEVDVAAAGTGWDVTVIGSRSDGLLTERWSIHQQSGASALQLTPRVVLELLPTRATWSAVSLKDKTRASRYDFMHVGALDLTAALVWDDAPLKIDDIAGFIWEDPDGTIRDSLGNTMPTVEVAAGPQTFEVYFDEPLDVLGYQSPAGQVIFSGQQLTKDGFPRLLGGLNGPPGMTGSSDVYGDALPVGAHDLTIRMGTGKGAWGQAEVSGRTVYVGFFPTSADKPIRSIEYTGADGQRVSLRLS